MRAVLGHSDHFDSATAIEAAIQQCEAQLGGETPKAVLLAASVEYDHAVMLEGLRRHWPESLRVGSTTDGEISAKNGYHEDSVLVVAFAGENIDARVIVGRDLSSDPEAAIAKSVEDLGGFEPRLALLTASPTTDGNYVAQRMQELLGSGCTVVGGLSADHREFANYAEFYGDEVLHDSVVGLLLAGDFHAACGIGSGWMPIGDAHLVTKSAGHVVSEINGRPAIDVYRDYWGELPADSLGEFPIAVYPDGPDGEFYLRASLGHDEQGAIRFAGDVPQGASVRITEVLPEGILEGSAGAILSAFGNYAGSHPEIAFAFSCAARKWVLGTQASEDCGSLVDGLQRYGVPDLALAGGYYFGEIGAAVPACGARLHNESCIAVVIGD
ncbi:MAG: FIST C-terminal domain-containing protein [Planctomycetes bacterium]|nr:FIST C-terminal domain-containing protein [Planctomycetota bacterium]